MNTAIENHTDNTSIRVLLRNPLPTESTTSKSS